MKTLITGCGSGLGLSLFKKMTDQGFIVIPHCRDDEASLPGAIIGDINKSETRDAITDSLEKHDINIFINNAAIYQHKPFLDFSDYEITEMLNTNLVSPVLLIRKVCQWFHRRGGGLIININSIAYKNPGAFECIYSASKSGLKCFSESLQIESKVAPINIKVIDIYLGAMKTKMSLWRNNYNDLIDPDEAADVIIKGASTIYKSLTPTEIVIRRN